MRYLFDHTVLYNHNWTDFLFAIALIVVVYFFIKKMKEMKTEEETLEKQISEKFTGAAMAQEELPEEMRFERIKDTDTGV